MEPNFIYIGWIAFGIILAIAVQLYFFRPKNFSDEYEDKIDSICIAFKTHLYEEIEELYKKKRQIENTPIPKNQIFPEIREDLVMYKLDDVSSYSSKYHEWSDALKNGKTYLKNLGKSVFFLSVVLLIFFHILSIDIIALSTNISGYIIIGLIYIVLFPIMSIYMNIKDYGRLTKQIDAYDSLIKKGDLKSLFKKSE